MDQAYCYKCLRWNHYDHANNIQVSAKNKNCTIIKSLELKYRKHRMIMKSNIK